MTKPIRSASLSLIVLLAGCGGDVYKAKPGPPHGGTTIAIPGDQGFVEVVKKPITGKEDRISGELTFYFFKDESTPYKPAPTSGTLHYGKNQTVELKVEGEGLTTPEGPSLFNGGEPDGKLSVYIDGKSVIIPMGVR